MRYASIRSLDISNGEGVGVALFVQGCPFHCKGCFNPETWSFDGGKEWTQSTFNKFLTLLDKPYIKRVTILGGEPLCDQNIEAVTNILATIKGLYPDVKIWLYTGYQWDELTHINSNNDIRRLSAIRMVDILCEGRFMLDQQDINHKTKNWVGSTNQRVINITASFESGTIVQYGES